MQVGPRQALVPMHGPCKHVCHADMRRMCNACPLAAAGRMRCPVRACCCMPVAAVAWHAATAMPCIPCPDFPDASCGQTSFAETHLMGPRQLAPFCLVCPFFPTTPFAQTSSPHTHSCSLQHPTSHSQTNTNTPLTPLLPALPDPPFRPAHLSRSRALHLHLRPSWVVRGSYSEDGHRLCRG